MNKITPLKNLLFFLKKRKLKILEIFFFRISLRSQLVAQLATWVSCGWWRGEGGSMWGYPSTNHNSLYEQVVTLDLFNLLVLPNNFGESSTL